MKELAKTQDDLHWGRRKQLIEKHKEIRELLNSRDPSFLLVTAVNVLTHLGITFWLEDQPWALVLLFSVLVGPLFHLAILDAFHEACHDNGAPPWIWNSIGKPFLLFVNLGLVAPATPFYFTHKFHHAYMGTKLDVKYPVSRKEYAFYDRNPLTRVLYLLTHPVSFAVRIGETWRKWPNRTDRLFHHGCQAQQLFFNLALLWYFGWKPLTYMLLSGYLNESFLWQGLKNLQDHWVDEKRTHTDSYYGVLNLMMHNLGYHREHHDFPSTPGRYLPLITKIGKAFYLVEDSEHVTQSIYKSFLTSLKAPSGCGLWKHAPKLPIK